MNYLNDISSKLKLVDIDEITVNVVDDNEHQIRNWITDRWLLGKNPNGDMIGLYQGEEYANEKYSLNNRAGFGNVDLTYSGLMGRSIEISGFNNEFEVFSTVDYYDKIIDDFGEVNFNITEAEKNKLTDIIFIVIFNDINEAYG
jgi:hypothetical protein